MQGEIICVAFETSMEGCAFTVSADVSMRTIFRRQRIGFCDGSSLGPIPGNFLMQHEEALYHRIHANSNIFAGFMY